MSKDNSDDEGYFFLFILAIVGFLIYKLYALYTDLLWIYLLLYITVSFLGNKKIVWGINLLLGIGVSIYANLVYKNVIYSSFLKFANSFEILEISKWITSEWLEIMIIYFFLYGGFIVGLIAIPFVFIGIDPRKELLKGVKEFKPKMEKAEKYKNDKSKNAVVLGVDIREGKGKKPIGIPSILLNRHTLVMGGSGSGKTIVLYNFIYSALQQEKPLIYIDGKGERTDVETFKKYCNHFNTPYAIIKLDGSEDYNPFDVGTPTELTDKIISMFEWTEDYYKQNSYSFTQQLIKLLKLKRIDINLQNIVYYSRFENIPTPTPVKNSDNELSITVSAEPDTEEQRLMSNLKAIDKKSYSGFIAKISNLVESDFGEMLKGDFCIDYAIREGKAIMFSLDSKLYPEQANQMGKLITSDLKGAISKHSERGGGPVTTIFDEFNVFASHQVVDIINKSRSAGFEAVISFQSFSDIDRLEKGEELRRQIVANCNTFITGQQVEGKDAEETSSLFGTVKEIEKTYQVDVGSNDTSTELGSMKGIRQFRVHPDDLKDLKQGEVFTRINNQVNKLKVLYHNKEIIK